MDLATMARVRAAEAYRMQYPGTVPPMVQGAHDEAAFYFNHPMPMKGYTSPEMIADARMNAAYYNQHPGGMRGGVFDDRLGGWSDDRLSGLGEMMDSKTLLWAAAGAAVAMFLLPKKFHVGGKWMNAGVGAAAAVAVSNFIK